MNTDNITFEKLPEAVGFLIKEVAHVKELVAAKEQPLPHPAADEWFNIDELIKYLPTHPAKQTVYDWVHKRLIPVHKEGQRKLSFLKSEIDDWLKSSKQKTIAEIEIEAEQYLEGLQHGKR